MKPVLTIITAMLLAPLRELGLADNTLIVFTHDNGGGGNNAAIHTRNTAINIPYRGHTFDVWEGGLRVPFMMHWPRQVPAGQSFDGIVSTVDVFPTFATAASTAFFAWQQQMPKPVPPPAATKAEARQK